MARPPLLSRRTALTGLTLSAAALLDRTPTAAAAAPATADMCLIAPQSVEGPFYLDRELVRSQIGEGRPGVPLQVRLQVVEGASCAALAKARVDIWHADAHGLYSGFDGQGDGRDISTTGQKFLRGTQFTDKGGWVGFETIYPGWYDGRATHIHFKVFLQTRDVLTGQIYFPDALNEFIYTNVPAYQGRKATRQVINANDMIATHDDPDHLAFCSVKEAKNRYVATLVVGVDRGAKVRSSEGPTGPPPGPPTAGGGPPPVPALGDRLKALVPGAD